MSLKGFHLVFISAAALLATWMGFWFLGTYRQADGNGTLAGIVASFLAAGALAAYGAAFWRKAKQL